MNWTNKQNKDRLIEKKNEAMGGGGEGVEGSSKKEKGLMDVDNRGVIARGRGI